MFQIRIYLKRSLNLSSSEVDTIASLIFFAVPSLSKSFWLIILIKIYKKKEKRVDNFG